MPKMSGDLWSKFDSPTPDRFVRDVDTAFEEHFLDFTQAEIEANVEPDRVGDDFGREAVAFLANSRCLHRPQLRPNCRANNKSGVNVTTPALLRHPPPIRHRAGDQLIPLRSRIDCLAFNQRRKFKT